MKALTGISLTIAMSLLAACGQVVTPEPTVTTPSTGTPATVSAASTRRPTATAPLLPPADTATPTVTPTPVVHVVQQGDTLQAIAFDYGVTVEALQRVNGIENPQFLQIGQRLVIPADEETDEEAPEQLLPTPTPQPIKAQSVALYETPVGGLWSLGEVVNSTEATLTNVQVRVTLLDGAGGPLAEADTFVAADLVPPGARSPFGILFTSPPSTWASYQVSVVRAQEAGALADLYVPIEVSETEGRPSGAQLQVSGVAQNRSGQRAAQEVEVIVTTYDAQGAVTGFRQRALEMEGALPPGATVPFSLPLTVHGGAPEDFHVTALGRVSAD